MHTEQAPVNESAATDQTPAPQAPVEAVADKTPRKPRSDKQEAQAVVKHFVTTESVRAASGRIRDPHTGQVFSRDRPLAAEVRPGNWIDCQIKAGLLKEYKV